MLKCESCLSRFQQASDLFQHIQSSCLLFYKKHPEHWAEILSKMPGPAESEDKNPVGSTDADKVEPAEIDESSAAKNLPQTNPTKKEVPFCIMFKAQKVKKGQPVLSLQMTVTEYYYGAVAGKRMEAKQVTRSCKCSDCGKSLRNNIRFMSHLRHKILNRCEKKEGADARNICNHCFREYSSPFLLQCHLENVHGAVAASTTCKICDSHYPTDKEFLGHMKDIHVQNEAPYSCKVCSYRSSFYNDVMKHFRDHHANTTALICPFCLFVATSANTFSKHVLLHVKKGFACNKCRLIFATTVERQAHQNSDHVSQHMKEKMAKYKNSHLCQIYVKAAPYEEDRNDKMLKSDLGRRLNGSCATKILKCPMTELPTYLCPAKRSNCVRKIRTTKETSLVGMKCLECGEALTSDSASIREHFRYQRECKWCIYVTSCERASQNHVLREHANAEMREQMFGKTVEEDTSFPIILQDDEVDDTLSKIKEEPEDIIPSVSDCWGNTNQVLSATKASETHVTTQKEPVNSGKSPPAKARRKQTNPTKILDLATPVQSIKAIRRDRCVQTKGLEKEKGVQACDLDFQNLHGNVDQLGTTSLESKGNNRKRKVLAQPGYLPDIDDDAGWSKYFATQEKNVPPGKQKKKANPSNAALPTMVPRPGTFSILNKALKAQVPDSRVGNDSKVENNITCGGQRKKVKRSFSREFTTQLGNSLRFAPLAPNNLRCIDVTHDFMLIQWDPPSNGSVTQYKIVFQGVGPQTVQILPIHQTLVKLVGLKSDVMYSVRVYTLFYTGVSDYASMYVKTKSSSLSATEIVQSVLATTSTKLQPQPVKSNMTTTVAHHKTVGVPLSNYLTWKSAAISNTKHKHTPRAVGSTYPGYETDSVSSMLKSVSSELMNVTKDQNSAANRPLAVTTTAPISSTVSVVTNMNEKIVTASKASTPESNFKYSIPADGASKKETKDKDDEDEKSTTTGALSNAKTTVQSCVTMDGGDVILVLDHDNGSSQSIAKFGNRSLAVDNKKDGDVSLPSKSDTHVVNNGKSDRCKAPEFGSSSSERGTDNIFDIMVVSKNKIDAHVKDKLEDTVMKVDVDAEKEKPDTSETDPGLYKNKDDEKEDDRKLERMDVDPKQQNIYDIFVHASTENSSDCRYDAVITGCSTTDNTGESLTERKHKDNARDHKKENDCNSMLKKSEDLTIEDPGQLDVPDVYVHDITEHFSDYTDGNRSTAGRIGKGNLLEQNDQDNTTDTDSGDCLADGGVREGDKTRETSEIFSTKAESDVAVNDPINSIDDGATLTGSEEVMSIGDADQGHVAAGFSETATAYENVNTITSHTDAINEAQRTNSKPQLEENSGSINLVKEQLTRTPSATKFDGTTNAALENATTESLATFADVITTSMNPVHEQSVANMNAVDDNELNVLCTQKTEPEMLGNIIGGSVTVQSPTQHAALPASNVGVALQNSEPLHGNVLQNVGETVSNHGQQDNEIKSLIPNRNDNLTRIDSNPEITSDDGMAVLLDQWLCYRNLAQE